MKQVLTPYNKKMHLSQITLCLALFAAGLVSDVSLGDEPEKKRKIIIEESPYSELESTDGIVKNHLLTYKKRRESFGTTFAVDYSMYEPINYQPNFLPDTDFESEYGDAEVPLIAGTFGLKFNLGFGSLGLDGSVGYYQNTGSNESSLTLYQYGAGATLALDMIMEEPYFVPYGTFGVLLIEFSEEFGNQGYGGTEPHFYYEVGGLFQVDWLDRDGDYNSYEANGIENTFLNIGLFGVIGSPVEDADFTSSLALQAGLKIEI